MSNERPTSLKRQHCCLAAAAAALSKSAAVLAMLPAPLAVACWLSPARLICTATQRLVVMRAAPIVTRCNQVTTVTKVNRYHWLPRTKVVPGCCTGTVQAVRLPATPAVLFARCAQSVHCCWVSAKDQATSCARDAQPWLHTPSDLQHSCEAAPLAVFGAL